MNDNNSNRYYVYATRSNCPEVMRIFKLESQSCTVRGCYMGNITVSKRMVHKQ